MAKLNWNRPNSGYENEPWRKVKTKKEIIIKSPDVLMRSLGKHHAHDVSKKISYQNGYKKYSAWCNTCNHLIRYISESDYKNFPVDNSKQRMISQIVGFEVMPFGVHKNKPINQLPDAYLKWAVLHLDTTIAHYLSNELQRRFPELK